jgi:transposase
VKYFKNTELASLYKISEKSVRNWIAAVQEGKIDLQLYDKNNKSFIANTSKNIAVIEELVEKGQ